MLSEGTIVFVKHFEKDQSRNKFRGPKGFYLPHQFCKITLKMTLVVWRTAKKIKSPDLCSRKAGKERGIDKQSFTQRMAYQGWYDKTTIAPRPHIDVQSHGDIHVYWEQRNTLSSTLLTLMLLANLRFTPLSQA